MKKVLSIAGSDCSGGAGIQADIKTITANGLYAMSVITALTAQNTQNVQAIKTVTPKLVALQMDSVFTDIIPDAIKIGMIPNFEIADIVAKKLVQYNAKNIVIDPVMVASSKDKLIEDNAILAICNKLFPLASVITPNIQEAEVLCSKKISKDEDAIHAAKMLVEKFNIPVLLKGGHLSEGANDYLCSTEQNKFFYSQRIVTKNTHGTGCTLSSAIACELAKGKNLAPAIHSAKQYITGALKYALDIGNGSGPVNHIWNITK